MVLVVTAQLDAVEISGQRVRAGSGAVWGAVNGRAQRAGMLGLAGTASDVGVAGYAFGGGVGWLARAHGLGQLPPAGGGVRRRQRFAAAG